MHMDAAQRGARGTQGVLVHSGSCWLRPAWQLMRAQAL
jgi:hypothetical protein